MISVALDTATDHCSVAATDGVRVERRAIDGARRHAAALLGLVDDVLTALHASPSSIGRVLTADGPGSFTGLRVGATVAHALVWHRDVEWRAAPSLLLRAAGVAPSGRVLALTDALRGEVFAGCWDLSADAIIAVGPAPRAMRPAALAQFRDVDHVVAGLPVPLLEEVARATGWAPISGAAALPDAASLFALAEIPGGTTLVADPAAWQPDYGRPAEAQAVWERAHGRSLPTAARRPG